MNPDVKTQKIWDEYHHWFHDTNVWKGMHWRGVRTLKMPWDMWNYQEIISELKVEFVIETGTRHGGSAFFFADLLMLHGERSRVFTIDIDHNDLQLKSHPKIEFLLGSSADPQLKGEVFAKLPENRGPIFMILDSDHRCEHVYEELKLWVPALKTGDYLVVEDSNVNGHPVRPDFGPGPYEAVEEFTRENPGVLVADIIRERKFGPTAAPNGFWKIR